jgi:acyl-CoA synthetase (AMP-forming)/AMP-acid ligase II
VSVPVSIPAALADAAERFPDRDALVDGEIRITFAELHQRASAFARAIVGSRLGPGDRVALWAPNSAEWIVASFGVYAAGCVLVPINTRYRGEEAGHILRTSGARLLFTVTDFLDTSFVELLHGVEGLGSLEEIVVLSGDVPEHTTSKQDFLQRTEDVEPSVVDARTAAISEDTTSDIIFTSGTTGAPKGAMLGHGASVRTYRAWSELVDLRAGDRYLVVYPFFHTAGLKSGVLACVLQGATIYPQPVFDVPAVLELVARERITMLPGPPTVFQTILEHPDLASFDLSSIRSSVTGAAVVPVEVIRRMRDELKIRTVVTGYGMTETTGTISMCRYDDPPEVIATTVGRPIPGVDVRVLDDDEATRAAIQDGWLRTGDIGLVDDDGNLHITDRKKDMFIVGGFNAYPAEIEAVLLHHPAVAQVAVVGMPDERMGEIGVAFVVPRAGARAGGPEELPGGLAAGLASGILAWAHERLAGYKLSRVELIDALPLNPSGKVMKFKLRENRA